MVYCWVKELSPLKSFYSALYIPIYLYVEWLVTLGAFILPEGYIHYVKSYVC